MSRASDIWERIVRVAAYEHIAWGGIGPKFRFGGTFIQQERPWSGVVDLDNLDERLAADLMGFFVRHADSLVVHGLALREMWHNGDLAHVTPTELMGRLVAGDRAADQREQVLVLVGYEPDHPIVGLAERALRKAHERLGGDGKRFHARLFEARFVRVLAELDDDRQRELVQADLPSDHRGTPFFATHREALAACIGDLVGWREDGGIVDREMSIIATLHELVDPEYIRLADGRPWTRALRASLSDRYARWVQYPSDASTFELLAMHAGARVLAAPEVPVEIPAIDPLFARMLAFIDDMLMPDEIERIWRAFCET